MTNETFTTEQQLLERYACMAFEKQEALAEAIGTANWNVDMGKGEICFGDSLCFPIQVLGTISHAAQTWLWSWANTRSGLSPQVTKLALELKAYGEKHGIPLLSNDSFDFTSEELHLMGLIASGMSGASAYYIADYGQGAMLVTVNSEQIDRHRSNSHLKIMTVFPQVILQYEMNHRQALEYYLSDKGYAVSHSGDTLTGKKDSLLIKASFDDIGRLVSLNG